MFSINYSDLVLDRENVSESMRPLIEYLIKEKNNFDERAKFVELTFSLKSFGFSIFENSEILERKLIVSSDISRKDFENIISQIIADIKPVKHSGTFKIYEKDKFYTAVKNLYKNIDVENITKEVFDLGNKFKKIEIGSEIYIEFKRANEEFNIPNLKINFKK